MFEHKSKPLLSKKQFHKRVFKYVLYSSFILGMSLGIGMVGYWYYADLNWIDAFYNASMILTGMGPANEMPDNAAKIFSGTYALFSGVAFLSTVAVLFAPIAHRFLHLMHIDDHDK
ncbi:MAG: hypothetical protein KDC85_14850 [Saprospiraceae bacterium]|nr:hypothetical protein [Saprospiraceae bacterium]MCB9323833.1 hypothetical protein [Lewinellaceae bacterium]